MRSFLLFAAFAACLLLGESALLGSKKCTYGPSYWCDSLPNAKECSAVKHCIQTVWENQILPEDNDDICTICKNMVQEARDQLLSNETQEEIREVFEGSCKLIPIEVVVKECIELADNFIPELIDTLASQMNPQLVCATAGLCNSARIDMLIRDYQLSQPKESKSVVAVPSVETPGPGDCESCKDFVTRTIRLVKTHSRAELLDRLLAICGQLGSLSDGCDALVEANFDDIYHFLTQQLTPEAFCDLVEMCETRMHQTASFVRTPLKHSGDEACDFCEAIVQHWRDVLTSNTTEEEFKEILDGLCRQSGKFKKNCLALVDEYYLPVYNFLMSEVQPKEICEAVGLCGLSSIFKKDYPVWTLLDSDRDVVAQTNLVPALMVDSEGRHMTGADEAKINGYEEPVLPRVKLTKAGIKVASAGSTGILGAPLGKGHVGDDNTCVMCEFAVHFLQNMLEQKSTREEIEQAVDQLCSMMPHTVAEECQDYVDAYGDQVIELLAQEMDPKQICPMLHLCPGVQQLESTPVVKPGKEDVSCVMCEYAMTQLEDILQDKKTEADIQNALDNLCSYLPKTVRAECQAFVDTYTDQIIQMLINDLSPDEVCVQLGLCKPKDETPLPMLDSSHQLPISRMFLTPPEQKTEDDFETSQSAVCVLCEFAMMQLDNMLSENATEDEIIEVVDYVCAHLPGTLSDDCIGFIEEYGDAIIKLLVHELSPKTICQQIKLCKAPAFTGLRAVLNVQLDKCQVCKGVVSYVDARLKEGDLTVDIDTILEEVCSVFPRSVDDRCRSIVEVYGPYLANLLAELGDPEKVCQAVKLCEAERGLKLLGQEKCTWGPAYWCQTQFHASACKATSHCTTKVWMGTPPQI